jgi:hypothetical protein
MTPLFRRLKKDVGLLSNRLSLLSNLLYLCGVGRRRRKWWRAFKRRCSRGRLVRGGRAQSLLQFFSQARKVSARLKTRGVGSGQFGGVGVVGAVVVGDNAGCGTKGCVGRRVGSNVGIRRRLRRYSESCFRRKVLFGP